MVGVSMASASIDIIILRGDGTAVIFECRTAVHL
jgi:hypothetical protein